VTVNNAPNAGIRLEDLKYSFAPIDSSRLCLPAAIKVIALDRSHHWKIVHIVFVPLSLSPHLATNLRGRIGSFTRIDLNVFMTFDVLIIFFSKGPKFCSLVELELIHGNMRAYRGIKHWRFAES